MTNDSTLSNGEANGRSELWHVIAISFPVVVTTSSRALMDIADYVMITALRSDDAQAAILPAQMVIWPLIVFGMGLVSVVSTFASQHLGRKSYRECSVYGWQVMYLAVLSGVAAILFYPLLPHVIDFFGHGPGVQVAELAYMKVALLTVGPTVASAGLGWFFIGIHRPWVTMWSVIEANVVNAVVSYTLIFGCLGFESMGIAGAAWGTLAGVCYRTVRLTLVFLSPSMQPIFEGRRTWRPAWRRLKDLVRLGLPCGVHYFFEVVVWALFVNWLIGARFGAKQLIATGVAWQYMRLAFMPTVGVGQALTAMVGKAIGARDTARAMRETRIAVLITLAYMGSLSLIYFLFGDTLVSWFNADPEVVATGRWIMVCAAVFQLFDAFGITYDSALRGAGDTFVPAVFFVVTAWVVIIGGGWLMVTFAPSLGSLGPWIAASVFIMVAAVFLWWRWRSRIWMGVDLFRVDAGGSEESPAPGGV